jgi:hypothetical protein
MAHRLSACRSEQGAGLVGCRIPHRTPIPCRRFPAACWPLAGLGAGCLLCCLEAAASSAAARAVEGCKKRLSQGIPHENGNVAPGVPSLVRLHIKWRCHTTAAGLQQSCNTAPPWRHGAWRCRRSEDSDARLRPRGPGPVTGSQGAGSRSEMDLQVEATKLEL